MTPLTFERIYNAPVERVWRALTEPEQIAAWFVPFSDFKPEPGFEFTFMGVTKEGTPKKHLCRVIEAVTNVKLSYSWRYEGFPGDSLVTWELAQDGDRTKLTLTHAGLETFPAEPAFARENYEKGWTHFTGTLQTLVETN